MDAAQQLIDGLHGLTVPGLRTDPHQCGGQLLQHRERRRVSGIVGADRHQQIALAGSDRPAGDGGIDQMQLRLGELGGHLADGIDADGRGQDDDRPQLQHLDHAVGAVEGLVELDAVAHREQDHIRAGGGFPGGAGRGDAGLLGQRQPLAADVVTADAEFFGQARRHGQTHGSKPQDGDDRSARSVRSAHFLFLLREPV